MFTELQMKRLNSFVLILILLFVCGSAYALTIKIGCIAPADSPWGTAIRLLGAKWKKATGGEIVLKPYLSGVAGSEKDMIRKMRIGQLHAAVLTMDGLKEIYRDVMALSSPFLVRNGDELDYVLQKMQPHFEREFEKRGFRNLEWITVGWVKLFSRRRVIFPDDLKKQTLAADANDSSIISAWRSMGFRVCPINLTELSVGLQTGMVDAVYTTQLASAAFQWFATANHMISLDFAPVFCGIIVRENIWERIPERLKPVLLKAVREIKQVLYREAKALEAEALRIMKKHGLVVHQVADEGEERWRSIMARGIEAALDGGFSQEVYDTIRKLLFDYRRLCSK